MRWSIEPSTGFAGLLKSSARSHEVDTLRELVDAASRTCDLARIGEILDGGFDVNFQDTGIYRFGVCGDAEDFGDDLAPAAILSVARRDLVGSHSKTEMGLGRVEGKSLLALGTGGSPCHPG